MENVTPETLIARWRQIILNPTIPAEQLARLNGVEELSAHLALTGGRGSAALMTGLAASQNDGQSTPASYVDDLSDDANGSSVEYEDEDDMPINSSLLRGGISRTDSIGTGAYSSDAEQDSISKGKYRQGGKPKDKEKERTGGLRDTLRRPKEKREKDRGGAGGGGDAFSIDD
ncbi:hypothetical protein GGI22_003525, partial [Coemansia erecta]